MPKANEIKYLTAIKQEKPKKKFSRFEKYGIKYIDYKDVEFLKKFINEQGKILPRRLSGNSLKYQRKVLGHHLESPPNGASALCNRFIKIDF